MKTYNERCPVCGKLFYVGDRRNYAYKRGGKYDKHRSEHPYLHYYCSWTCYRSCISEEQKKKERSVYNELA